LALTAKQQAFVSEYTQCWNASEAARRAGYSEATAQEQGSRLLSNVMVSAEIERFKAQYIMSAEEVAIRLTEQGRGDIGDFLTKNGDAITVDLPKAIKAKKTDLIKKLSQTRTVRTRGDDETEETVSTTIELYDRQAALVQIGKIHKMFTDRQEISGPEGGALPIIVLQPGDLDKLKK
jgi:phage terminase small subunit